MLDLDAPLSLATATAATRPPCPRLAPCLLQLRTAIETRLNDPGLDPETAAAAAGISVRYANALLATRDVAERLIVSRRLAHCRRALEDPRQAIAAIGEIAYAWGFGDQSHFTRRFKAAYERFTERFSQAEQR